MKNLRNKINKIKNKLETRLNLNQFQLTTPTRLFKINEKLFEINMSNEIFLSNIKKELTLDKYSQNEIDYYKNEVAIAKNGDDEALELLKNEFKYNENFKKETGVFKNV